MKLELTVEVDGASLMAEVSQCTGATHLPLVFLHAGVADGRMWQPQWDAFQSAHPMLRYDRRGFGQSRTTAAVPYSRTRDLWAVLDAVAWDRVVLVGCSQGGRVAVDAALAQPGRVAALVLVAPAIGGAPEPALSAEAQALDEAIDAADEAGQVDLANELEAQLWLDGPSSPAGRVGGAVRDLFLSMNGIALRADDPGPVQDEPPAWERLEQLNVPTLVLWGDLDLPHLQGRCQQLLQRIPGAEGGVLPGTAHLPGLEAPGPFNDALARFLRGPVKGMAGGKPRAAPSVER